MTEANTMSAVAAPSTFDRYLELCKPKVVALIVFTAVVGMLLAVPGLPPLGLTLLATIGIGLASASAAAINHLIDRREDAIMARTRHRPLPTGQLSAGRVAAFAAVLGALGIAVLWWLVNPLTAILTFASLIGYAIIYTVFLKRATPQNIVIGGAAGAAPPLLGWIAITGSLDAPAFVLFLIIFAWTPPHFWALALYRRHDYAAVDIPMLPVTHGVTFTRWQILFYTVILFLVTLLPYLIGMSGLFYLGGAVVLGLAFLHFAYKLLSTEDEMLAMRVFSYSVIYLIALFAFLLVDHYLPIPHPLYADTQPGWIRLG
ncbi:MAG: heme o synthase [Pseudomonadota bacterium]